MSYLTADDAIQDFFRGVVEPVEVRDSEGKVLGHYTPVVSPEEAARYEKIKGLFDPEELKRRKASKHPGYTFEQVMEHIHSLEKQS